MRLFALSLVLLLAGGAPAGSSPPRVVTPVGETGKAAGFTFRVDTPPVLRTENPDGTLSLAVEGLGVRARHPGAPDIPTQTVLVAIPPGAVPGLVVREVVESVQIGARPRAVARERVAFAERPSTAGERRPDLRRRREHREDPAIYGGGKTWPERLAWLGETGRLRDQRYVEVHLAPVRYDPEAGGLRIARSFEVDVLFEGWDPSRASPATDSRFEGVYRKAFVNYGQGTRFRTSAVEPARAGTSMPVAISPPVDARSSEISSTSDGGVDDPSARARIRLSDHGVVRLDYALISGTDFITEPLSTWKLTNRGVEIPLHVMDDDGDGFPEATDGNDMLDPGEWVQFWGQALDDEPKAVLNTDLAGNIDLWDANDFTDLNPYFLTLESGTRARMGTRDGLPTHSRIPPTDFEAVAHEEIDDAWRPLGSADPWYWGPTLFDDGTSSRSDPVTLAGLASGADDVRVRVQMQGRSEDPDVFPDHTTRVTLLDDIDQVLAIDNDDGTFDGRTVYLHDFVFSPSGSQVTGTVNVKLEVLSNAAPSNDAILDWIEVVYRRSFTAAGDVLVFDWPDENAEFVVSGLASAAPRVYELTAEIGASGVIDAVRLTDVEITGSGPYTARFRIDDRGGTSRRFVVAGDGGVYVPAGAELEPDTVSDLRSTAIQADIIVITHPDVLDDPSNCADADLTQLLSFRAGLGLTSKVACIEDVEDEFNYGIPGPQAIKNFLAWVLSDEPGEGWADPEPAYVMLLGDSSYDYKAGTVNGTYVPTQIVFKDDPAIGYYASDNLLAAVEGNDHIPDLMIGRVSIRSPQEANDLLPKLRLYEHSTATGNWLGNALLVSDRGKGYDSFEAEEFERINNIAATKVTRAGHTAREMQYWSGSAYCNQTPASCDEEIFKIDIKANLNGDDVNFYSAAMMQFNGHGNFVLWSDDVVFCVNEDNEHCDIDDTTELTNGLKLPWLIVNNCLTGGFHGLGTKSFGEQWLKVPGGGAIAVLAPSGLGFRFIGEVVTQSVWTDVWGPTKERSLGLAALNSAVTLCTQGSDEACQYYVLLGDPATEIQIPAPDPPSGLAAVSGNGVVDLTWTASPTENDHDVYRSGASMISFQKVTSTPVDCTPGAACGYSDTGVLNAATYFYYVVARDNDGFESAQSNFNSDCDVQGPDCVKGAPLNPGPPSDPTGLVVTDAETGGRLDLGWTPNSETDLDFYTVHYGTQSGVYDQSVEATLAATFSLTGLENGQEYFIAVSATNTSGHTSVFSLEQTGIPSFVRGLKAPAFIDDLHVDKAGVDAVLSWSAVTVDIYGKPESVDLYEIYRGTSPLFVPAVGNRIGTSTSPSFTDEDALMGGMPDYHYLVRAVDLDGNGGGLGGQLPDGIADLRIGRAGETASRSNSTTTRSSPRISRSG
jgi:hypothetical protein